MPVEAPVRWLRRLMPRGNTGAQCFRPADFSPALSTQLLILQPTPFCNIDCDYCYLPDRKSTQRMSLGTVRRSVERLLEDGLVGPELTVVWHAGEPLTMPREFYDEACEAIQALVGSRSTVSHSIQTNGTLIDEAWCDLFKRRGIRVGISVDGPAELHDLHRRTRSGKGTHARVVRAMALLREQGIDFHAIAVVTADAFRDPEKFFDFFAEKGVTELGCNFDESEGIHQESSLDGLDAAHHEFLRRLLVRSFGSPATRIREFVQAHRMIRYGTSTYRWQGKEFPVNAQTVPFALVTVGHDGTFCTFSPELLGQVSMEFSNFSLGNVHSSSFFQAAEQPVFQRLWADVSQGVEKCRASCAYFNFCGGGAPVNKLAETGTANAAETLYCQVMCQRPLDTVLAYVEGLAGGDAGPTQIHGEAHG